MRYQKRRYWKYRLYDDKTYSTGIQLDAPIITEYINLSQDGLLIIKMGYVWDGASGPTLDTKNTMVPSLIHDALYQLMRGDYLDRKWRKRADRILYEALIERGMWKFRAKIWYRAVRKGAKRSSKYNVITVP